MTDSNAIASQLSLITTYVNKTQNKPAKSSSDFESFLNAQNENVNFEDTSDRTFQSKQSVNCDEDNSNRADERPADTDSLNFKKKETLSNDKTDENVEELTKTIQMICQKIEETFDVTTEQIQTVLDSLGIEYVGLLDDKNVTSAIMMLTNSNETDLLTNQNLYIQMSEVTDFTENAVAKLADKIEISIKDLKHEVEDFQNMAVNFTENTESVENAEDTENTDGIGEVANFAKSNEKTDLQAKNDIQRDFEPKSEMPVNVSRETNGGKPSENREMNSPTGFIQNLLNKTTQVLNAKEDTVSFSAIETADIINQITESMKVEVTKEMSEISIKLQPETLGTVNVRIAASSEGTMTAQFTAQNENVKEILESQVVLLKENLEERGITVDAVEVMVAGHRFEEGRNDERNNTDYSKERGRKQRRIDLSSDDIDIEDEDVRIAKDMMIRNGSTIDYMA